MEKRLLTRQEAAQLFSVNARTIDRWIRIGALAKVTIPGSNAVRIPVSEIERLLEPLPFDDLPRREDEPSD